MWSFMEKEVLMARRAYPIAVRARIALARLAELGGADLLPQVLTSREAHAVLGRAWFHTLLRRDALPGIQIVRNGVWRADRDTFVAWLWEMSGADEDTDVLDQPAERTVAP
jgi:hypothetical protein